MKTSGQKSLPAIGFLTVTRDPEHGLFGGYLVLNSLGRPLEFHCTAPVRANRAQEILYGPTLDPYLFGERIGQTLLNKSKARPKLALTDVAPAMAARAFVSIPLTLVLDGAAHDGSGLREGELAVSDGLNGQREVVVGGGPVGESRSSPNDRTYRRDPSHSTRGSTWQRFRQFDMGGHRVAVVDGHPRDADSVAEIWPLFEEQIDLEEPFERIREAIGEARNSARA